MIHWSIYIYLSTMRIYIYREVINYGKLWYVSIYQLYVYRCFTIYIYINWRLYLTSLCIYIIIYIYISTMVDEEICGQLWHIHIYAYTCVYIYIHINSDIWRWVAMIYINYDVHIYIYMYISINHDREICSQSWFISTISPSWAEELGALGWCEAHDLRVSVCVFDPRSSWFDHWIYICIYIYMHIYIYICMYTYIYIYIYT